MTFKCVCIYYYQCMTQAEIYFNIFLFQQKIFTIITMMNCDHFGLSLYQLENLHLPDTWNFEVGEFV